MKHTNTLRFPAAATRLVATGLVMLASMAAAHNAYAVESVSDAELATQTGAATYRTGSCATTGGGCPLVYADCTPCPDENCGTGVPMAGNHAQTNFRDTRTPYQQCVDITEEGDTVPAATSPKATATCRRGNGRVGVLFRTIYVECPNVIDAGPYQICDMYDCTVGAASTL